MTETESTLAATLDIFTETPRLNAWILDRLRPWMGRRVLEVGSGLGTLTGLLLDREHVVATDVDPEFITRLRTRFAGHPQVTVEHVDLENVPVDRLAEHRVDTVLCVNVLEHVRDDRGALAALHRAVAPGGRLLIYVPALPWLYGSLDRGLQHHRRYSRRQLVSLLEAAGWRTVHVSWMNLAGIPGWFLSSRVLGRRVLPATQVSLYDHLVPLFRLEEKLRLPVGMSLVVVAYKD